MPLPPIDELTDRLEPIAENHASVQLYGKNFILTFKKQSYGLQFMGPRNQWFRGPKALPAAAIFPEILR